MNHLMETGTKLELKKVRHVETAQDTVYVSRYLSTRSSDEALIEMPTRKGVTVALEPGELFLVCFYTAKGLYQCQAQVTERFYEDGLPVAVIKMQSEFEKMQRRQYYRMECLINLAFREVDDRELDDLLWEKTNPKVKEENADRIAEEGKERKRLYDGIALDISGGGIRFNSEYRVEQGKTIVMKIAFLSKEAAGLHMLFGRVLTSTYLQNRGGMYEHRVQFEHISNDERETIIRYIFIEERKRRKKESGYE